MILIIILYAFFAAAFSLNKVLSSEINQLFFLIGSRMFIGGLILIMYLYLFDRKALKISKTLLAYAISIGFCMFLLSNFLVTWGIKHMSSIKSCLLNNLSPFITLALSTFIIKEKISFKKIIGLSIGFCGILPVIMNNPPTEELVIKPFFNFLSLPEIATILGTVFFCLGWVLMKKILITHPHFSPTAINGIAMLCSGIVCLTYALSPFSEPIIISNVPRFATYLFLIIFVMNVVYANLYSYLLKFYSATLLALSGTLSPIFAAIYGWIFLGETINWHFCASLMIIFLGLYIFYKEDVKIEKPVLINS